MKKSVALVTAALGLLAGCGDSGEQDVARSAPAATEFPQSTGKTLPQLFEGMKQSALVVSPAAQVFERGSNRYTFGIFTKGREQVTDADVALYLARSEKGRVIGPLPARVDSLTTEPAFRARTTSADDAKAVYVVPGLQLPRNGPWYVVAVINRNGKLEATQVPSLVAGKFPNVPGPGDRAPDISTPTAEDVARLDEIETRIPPDSMHEVDFAEVVGKKPVVLLFATPQLCHSRVCGPVVDVAEQVKQATADEVEFIHMEVYRDNDPNKGIRPQLAAFGLPTEPFLFLIDADGVVRERLEGAFGPEELERAVRGVS